MTGFLLLLIPAEQKQLFDQILEANAENLYVIGTAKAPDLGSV